MLVRVLSRMNRFNDGLGVKLMGQDFGCLVNLLLGRVDKF